MARKLRREYAGASYHVIDRGNYRRHLFRGNGTAVGFERCLDPPYTKRTLLLHRPLKVA